MGAKRRKNTSRDKRLWKNRQSSFYSNLFFSEIYEVATLYFNGRVLKKGERKSKKERQEVRKKK